MWRSVFVAAFFLISSQARAADVQAALTAGLYGDQAGIRCPLYGFKSDPSAWHELVMRLDPDFQPKDFEEGGRFEWLRVTVSKLVHADIIGMTNKGWCQSIQKWAERKYPDLSARLLSSDRY